MSIQLLWFKRFRESPFWLFMISIVVSVGMWLERFVIIVTSLNRDFPAVVVGDVQPDDVRLVDVYRDARFFFTLIYLFVRFLPIISIFEVRTLLPEANVTDASRISTRVFWKLSTRGSGRIRLISKSLVSKSQVSSRVDGEVETRDKRRETRDVSLKHGLGTWDFWDQGLRVMDKNLYGLLAEFDSATQLVDAANSIRERATRRPTRSRRSHCTRSMRLSVSSGAFFRCSSSSAASPDSCSVSACRYSCITSTTH
jgi:hypothetical protein